MVNVDVSYWKKYKMWYDKEKGNADEHDKDLKQVLLNNETGIGVIGALIMGASASALTIDFDEPASAVVAAYCGIMFASTMLAIAAVVYASLIFLNVNKLPASCVIHYWERAVVLPGDSLLLVLFSLALFFLGLLMQVFVRYSIAAGIVCCCVLGATVLLSVYIFVPLAGVMGRMENDHMRDTSVIRRG